MRNLTRQTGCITTIFQTMGPSNTSIAVLGLDLASEKQGKFPNPQASLGGGEEDQTELERRNRAKLPNMSGKVNPY